MVAAGNLIRATDLNNLVTLYYTTGTDGTTTVWTTPNGNVRQNVTGLTFDVITVNPNAIALVTWTIDTFITDPVSANNFQFRLEVDGVAQTGLAIASTNADNTRYTVSTQDRVLHPTPGTFTYQITGLSGSGSASCTVDNDLCRLSAVVLDLAA